MRVPNQTIIELIDWATNPDKMYRFEAVALLSQRTSFVKSLLGLTANNDLIRAQIQRVCKKNGVAFKRPRGKGFDTLCLKSFGPDVRYAASILLSMLFASGDGGLATTATGINHENLVDRMIYIYRRYMQIFGLTVADAPVSFELFFHLYRAYESGDIEMSMCGNCDSTFINFHVAQSIKCPVCQIHRHAEMPCSTSGRQYSTMKKPPIKRVYKLLNSQVIDFACDFGFVTSGKAGGRAADRRCRSLLAA